MSSIPTEVLGHSDAILSRAFLQNYHSSGFSCVEKSSVPQPLFVPPGRFSQRASPQTLSLASPTFAVWPFLAFRGVSRGWKVARGIWPHGEQVGVQGAAQKGFSSNSGGGLWDASARMELSFPHHQCTLAFSASQVCGSGFVGDASHSCIFCGESAHFPPSFCSDCQENLGSGADPVSPSCSHNTPMDFPSGGLAQANQTNFRSFSLLRLNRARK